MADSDILGEPKLFSLGEEGIVGSIVGAKEGMASEWVVSPFKYDFFLFDF